MADVFKTIEKVADTDSSILIYGESGTGKELIAKEIHYRSGRANGVVRVHQLRRPSQRPARKSNLFGRVRGSFTGAVKDQDGLLKVAEGKRTESRSWSRS